MNILNMVMTMINSKITMQSVRNGKVLAKNIPHPFSCYPLTTQLNPDAFDDIEGMEAYEEYSLGNDFGVDIDCGCAVNIKTCNYHVDLYENYDSITVFFPDIYQGYRYLFGDNYPVRSATTILTG